MGRLGATAVVVGLLAASACSQATSGVEVIDAGRDNPFDAGSADAASRDAEPTDAGATDAAQADPGPDALVLGRCEVVGRPGARCVGSVGEVGRFVPFTDGDTLTLLHGIQGSRIAYVAARARGIVAGDPTLPESPDNPTLDLWLTDESGAPLGQSTMRTAFVMDPASAGAVWIPVASIWVDGLTSTHVTLRGRVVDRDGAERLGAVRLMVTP